MKFRTYLDLEERHKGRVSINHWHRVFDLDKNHLIQDYSQLDQDDTQITLNDDYGDLDEIEITFPNNKPRLYKITGKKKWYDYSYKGEKRKMTFYNFNCPDIYDLKVKDKPSLHKQSFVNGEREMGHPVFISFKKDGKYWSPKKDFNFFSGEKFKGKEKPSNYDKKIDRALELAQSGNARNSAKLLKKWRKEDEKGKDVVKTAIAIAQAPTDEEAFRIFKESC